MRVYFESMIDELSKQHSDFVKNYGIHPNKVEMTRLEYFLLEKEMQQYLIKDRLSVDGEKCIMGMKIVIKGE